MCDARPQNLLKIHVCIDSTGSGSGGGSGSIQLLEDPAQCVYCVFIPYAC